MSRGWRSLHTALRSAITEMMVGTNTKMTAVVETYLADLRRALALADRYERKLR